ncbi:MAG: DMT family transporter, partial [Dongiaceae bacterium]
TREEHVDPAVAGGVGLPVRSNERLKGILFLSAGALIFTIQDVIIKWISGDYPVTQILATRSLVAFAPLFILLYVDGGLRVVSGRRFGRLLIRAGLLFLSYTAYYLAIAAIPLAEAGSLFYTAPLFIVALAGPVLHERVGLNHWTAVVVGFVGAMIMCRIGADVIDAAALFSLLAAALYALAQVMARDLGTTHRASVMALYQNSVNLAAALVIGLVAGDGAFADVSHPSLAFLLRSWSMPDLVDLLLMGSTGLVAAVAIWCLTHAYRIAEANVIAPFEYSSIIWLVLAGYFIWGEVPEMLTVAGGLLIIAAGIYVLKASRRSD